VPPKPWRICHVDAAAPLSTNDLQTIKALYEAGIPAQVLLSKADLLVPEDLERVLKYTAEHLKSEIGLDLLVHPVSVVGGHRELLHHWFENDIVPLFDRRQELRAASVRRKIGTLYEAVELALRSRLQRAAQAASGTTSDIHMVETELRRATARIEEADAAAKGLADSISTDSQSIFLAAAQRLLAFWAEGKHKADAAAELRHAALEDVRDRVKRIQQTLESLANELVKQLESTAQLQGTPNLPAQEEFHGLIREMPVLDLGALQVSAGPSSFAGLFGRRFQVQKLARHLSRQAGPQVENALTVYSRLLRDWCGTVVGQMQRRFAAYADAYRAQAERGASASEVSPEERRDLERDLELLAALSPLELGREPARQAS
jgi:hypothetical protein